MSILIIVLIIFKERISHPFSVAIFKETMYWGDWKQSSIFSANKYNGFGMEVFAENLPGIMGLKVSTHY